MRILFFFFAILSLYSCSMTDKEKLDKILNSEELFIQMNTFGGIAGYSEEEFHLKKGEYESLLIIREGTDYQTYVEMDKKKDLLKSFILEAYNTNISDRIMSKSCTTGTDSEYVFKSGLTTLKLRPDEKCDSIFGLIIYGK